MKVETGCDPIDECDDFSFFWDRGDDYEVDEDEDYEPDNIDSDMGFDPYMGCFSDDC